MKSRRRVNSTVMVLALSGMDYHTVAPRKGVPLEDIMMIRIFAPLLLLLLLTGMGGGQSLTAGKQDYKITKLVKKTEPKGDVISLSVVPVVDVGNANIGVAFFAPADNAQTTLGALSVGGGEFNWVFAQNGKPEYWASRLRSADGTQLGPLTVVRLAPDHVTLGVITIPVRHIETTGQFGMPAAFPAAGRIEVALARIRWTAKEREGLAKGEPIFVLVSNVLSIDTPQTRKTN